MSLLRLRHCCVLSIEHCLHEKDNGQRHVWLYSPEETLTDSVHPFFQVSKGNK